jgi:hypothetical protein
MSSIASLHSCVLPFRFPNPLSDLKLGRRAAAKQFNAEAIDLAVQARVRHMREKMNSTVARNIAMDKQV